MAKFTVNTHRHDPYRNFRFKVMIDGEYVAGLSKCGALKKTTQMVEWWESGDLSTSRKLPGKTTYDAITLEAGVTHDTTFEDWANKVNNYGGVGLMSLKNFRKDYINIDVFNLSGDLAMRYIVHRCWVSDYQALPELDASGNAVMIRTIKIEHEGWERDTSVPEPVEK